MQERTCTQQGKPVGLEDHECVVGKRDTGDGESWVWQVADGPVVPLKSGNADGGKGPWFMGVIQSDKTREIGAKPINSSSIGSEVTENAVCES